MSRTNKKLILFTIIFVIALFSITMIAYASSGPARIYSNDSSEMSRLVADETKSLLNTNKFSSVILVNCTEYKEAVSISYLSAQKKAPVLLLDTNNAEAICEYVNNNVTEKGIVYFISTDASLQEQIKASLSMFKLKNLTGEDIYNTNVKILREAKLSDNLLVCDAQDEIGLSVTASLNQPVLLVDTELSFEQKMLLFMRNISIVAINDIAEVVKEDLGEIETVLTSNSKYELSAMLAERYFPSSNGAILLSSANYPDGLYAGLLSQITNTPVLQMGTCHEQYADQYTQTRNILTGYVLASGNVLTNESVDIIFSSKTYVGHEFQDEIVPPTCLLFGRSNTCCSHCGIAQSTAILPAKGHNYEIIDTIEVTTGWDGYDIGQCKDCGVVHNINVVPKLNSDEWPKGYQDETGKITIYREWYENAYVYAAHMEFTDYSRLTTDGAYGKNNAGRETTSAAAERVGAIFMVNGDYAVPGNMANTYAIARNGVVFANGVIEAMGVYNNKTGIFTSPSALGIRGKNLSSVVQNGTITDTFQFADAFLEDGAILTNKASTSRAQRTFMGTNGNPGDIWLCVSDGRMNDGESAGLTGYQCAAFLKDKGCVFGIPLDGGGSSTIWFQGEVLNAAASNQRAVADFVYFK